MAKKVGGARKTETFTTRLEPREKYMLEILARVSGRSIAKTLEAAIELLGQEVKFPQRIGLSKRETSVRSLMDILWSPQEWRRIIALGSTAPELLTFDEECKLTLLTQSSSLCTLIERTSRGGIISVEVFPRRVELAWPLIEERAQLMADGKPAPPVTLEEIEEHAGEKLPDPDDDSLQIKFNTFHAGD